MILSEKAERKRFELWYNNHFDMELITGPDDVEAAWEIWKAALNELPVNAVGYVELSGEGQPTRFRTGCFGGGHPVYLSPVAAAISQPCPTTDITKRDLIKQAEVLEYAAFNYVIHPQCETIRSVAQKLRQRAAQL